MNSVSSSLSIYYGSPAIAVEGSGWKRMYVFLEGYFVRIVKILYTPQVRRAALGEKLGAMIYDVLTWHCLDIGVSVH